MKRWKVTPLGIFMNICIMLTAASALFVAWASGANPLLICVLIMLDVIAILVNECLHVLRDIREQTRRTGQR